MVSNASDPKKEKSSDEKRAEHDANRDPLSGRAGAHPVGTGIGAATGGVAAGAATGAAVGTVAGPVGTAVGAAVGAVAGAVAGGLAGKAIAEKIDPTVEHGFWRNEYSKRGYVRSGSRYEDYGPAYQYGWESYGRHHDKTFEQAEPTLQRDWNSSRGTCKLNWDEAKPAVRDSWNRVASYQTQDDQD